MFTFSVAVILYEALVRNKIKIILSLLGIITLAWWYAYLVSLSFSKNLKEKHICGAPCICRDQGLTSTQVNHQPASDKEYCSVQTSESTVILQWGICRICRTLQGSRRFVLTMQYCCKTKKKCFLSHLSKYQV